MQRVPSPFGRRLQNRRQQPAGVFRQPGQERPPGKRRRIEQDFPIGIGMADLDERPQPLDVDTHFLSQLAPEGLNCILTQLYLAAWKFP